MLVMVKGRAEGKTTALIDWCLQGHELPTFPYWSRLIITTGGVQQRDRIQRKLAEEADKRGIAHPMLLPPGRGTQTAKTFLNQLQKAVYDVDEVIGHGMSLRGSAVDKYEYAVDDVDRLIQHTLARAGLIKLPERVTLSGELWV